MRLRDEEGYAGSYPRRAAPRQAPPRGDGPRARAQGRRGVPDAGGGCPARSRSTSARRTSGPAAWPPGGGEYLTVAFPHPDVGPAQVFWGETTAECVCQGLLNVFEFVGGVPGEGGLRQRRRGRQARRRGGEDVRALPPLRGSLRARPHPHQPLLGQREGAASRTGSAATGGTSSSPVPSSRDVRALDRRPLEDCLDLSGGASAATGSARPSPSRSERTGRRSRRCRRPRSRA